MRTEGSKGGWLSTLGIICLAAILLLFVSPVSIRGIEAPRILWEDNFDNYSELPTHKYEFKFGDFRLENLAGNMVVYQDNEYTGERYLMIPKGLVINSKNYEIIFRGRIDIWAGLGIFIDNSPEWLSNNAKGNEFVEFSCGGYSISHPPSIHLWSRGYTPPYPPTSPPYTEIPVDNLFSWDNCVVRYTGDVGSYSDWFWVRVVSHETHITAYYGGLGETPNWKYMASIPHGKGNENPPYYIAIGWGNDQGYVDIVKVSAPWPGSAAFSLVNLYTVNVEKILDINEGSKLVVKFYTYGDVFENENIIENFIPPWYVVENESARHPEGVGVKKARLDLTTDNTENVISTIASFVVRKVDLEIRFSDIPLEWALASPAEKLELEIEFSDIPLYWALAPS